MNDSLDKRVRQFYDEQKLSAGQLSDLRSMIADATPLEREPVGRLSNRWLQMAVALMVVVCIGITGLIVQRETSDQQHLEQVAAEIALNHAKQFNTEFSTENIAMLGAEMPLLDFAPVYPKKLQYDQFDMMGARYCTIDSATAVQIRMADADNHDYTLYQFRDEPLLPLDAETVFNVEDIQVTLWREGNVMMGLAERK